MIPVADEPRYIALPWLQALYTTLDSVHNGGTAPTEEVKVNFYSNDH